MTDTPDTLNYLDLPPWWGQKYLHPAHNAGWRAYGLFATAAVRADTSRIESSGKHVPANLDSLEHAAWRLGWGEHAAAIYRIACARERGVKDAETLARLARDAREMVRNLPDYKLPPGSRRRGPVAH